MLVPRAGHAIDCHRSETPMQTLLRTAGLRIVGGAEQVGAEDVMVAEVLPLDLLLGRCLLDNWNPFNIHRC